MINFINMLTRLDRRGGEQQQDRMIKDKEETLKRAVEYSYQAAKIQKINSNQVIKGLMNPNKLLVDYDEKTLSVSYDYGFKTGDVFKWISQSEHREDTYWLIYLQDLTELAYFRADVRRCNYFISWQLNGQTYNSYAAVRGPKEQNISTIAKSKFYMDIPNYSLNILIPKTDEALEYFDRYTRFYLNNNEKGKPVCWRVEAVDAYSLPGILEIYAKEDYVNTEVDDIEKGIAGGLIEPKNTEDSNTSDNMVIVGDDYIKPGFEYTYTYKLQDMPHWSWDDKLPIVATIDGNSIKITWKASYSGRFDLICNDIYIKSVIVESLF